MILVNDGPSVSVTDIAVSFIKNAVPIFQHVQYQQNKGKGYALRKGVERSTAEICIYTDIDFPYTIESFLKIFNILRKDDSDIVAGIKNKTYYTNVPAIRKFISKFLRSVSAFFLRIKITDTQCGLKGFNEKGKQIFLQTTINRYLFDLEFIFLASRRKEIKLVPVEISLRQGVEFTKLPYKLLFTEMRNFLKIVLRSIFAR